MKILLVGKNLDEIRACLGEAGLTEAASEEEAEIVVTYGGDGTLLAAERDYPGLPKLPIRDAGTAATCSHHSTTRRLAEFMQGKTPLTRLPLIAGEVHGRTVYGINDVFLHNFNCSSALRYRVWIDGELYANEIVGDGAGMSSIHGSSAYYRSITHSIFRVGIGLAFSNSTEEVDHLVLNAASRVRLDVVRGPGLLVADNTPSPIEVAEGESVELYQAERCAEVYGLAAFMCPRCRLLRHPNKMPRDFFAEFK